MLIPLEVPILVIEYPFEVYFPRYPGDLNYFGS